MIKRDWKIIGIIAFIAIGVIILIKVLFSGKPSNNDKLNEQLLAAKDSVNAALKENVALHERIIEEKDRATAILQSRDSVLNAHYVESELNYKKINETLRNIPVRIDRISGNADSIRAAYRDF